MNEHENRRSEHGVPGQGQGSHGTERPADTSLFAAHMPIVQQLAQASEKSWLNLGMFALRHMRVLCSWASECIFVRRKINESAML
jgi:hypothetical protein